MLCIFYHNLKDEGRKNGPLPTILQSGGQPCTWRQTQSPCRPTSQEQTPRTAIFYPQILSLTLCKKQTRVKHLHEQMTRRRTPPGPAPHSKDPLRSLSPAEKTDQISAIIFTTKQVTKSLLTSKGLSKAEKGRRKRGFFTKVLAYSRGTYVNCARGWVRQLWAPHSGFLGQRHRRRTERPGRSLRVKAVCHGYVHGRGRTKDPGFT